MEQFEVFGLPTILFFDRAGNELSDLRVTGFQKAEAFSSHLNSLASQESLFINQPESSG